MPAWKRFVAFFALTSALLGAALAPAFELGFFSDDAIYLGENPWVQNLSAASLAAILDPRGEPARATINYAPLHLLAHALEWRLWQGRVLPYHIVNLLLHALGATLFAALLLRRGLARPVAFGAALLFALHPAQVESVAWISQLKTLLALALALGALLAHPRRPALALALFGAALLAKFSALFALPLLAAWTWAARSAGAARPNGAASAAPEGAVAGADEPLRSAAAALQASKRWLLGWCALAGLVALAQFPHFARAGEVDAGPRTDALQRALDVAAIGARYLWLAASGRGVAPFQQPDPAQGLLDPLALAGLALGLALAALCLRGLARGRESAAWLLGAAAAWLPVSQIFPFLFPLADRYLHPILPGLIGATCFCARELDLRWRLRARCAERFGPRAPAALGGLLALLYLAHFASAMRAQAEVWRSPSTIALASARAYPRGITAHRMRAWQAATRGDAATAAAELRGALARGFDAFMDLRSDPVFAALEGQPAYDAALRDVARDWIATIRARSQPSHSELYWTGMAHRLLGEDAAALEALERALAQGGPFDDAIRVERIRIEAQRRAAGVGAATDAPASPDASKTPPTDAARDTAPAGAAR